MSESETPSPEPTAQARPRLVRTRRGRLIGGVCSGLGAHFGVDPILLRIALVGITFFAGIGIWLYVAILLLVAEEGAHQAPVRLIARFGWRVLAGVLIALAALAALAVAAGHATLGGGGAVGLAAGAVAVAGLLGAGVWLALRRPSPQGWRSADRVLASRVGLALAVCALTTLVAAGGAALAGIERQAAAWALIALGACLIASAVGPRGARMLVWPALAFALPAAIFAAARVDLHGGLGERTYRPLSVEQLRSGYRLGAGRLEVDLRGVAFPPGATALHVRLGVGELVVLVPDQLCVVTRARLGGGFVGALDRSADGLDVDWSYRLTPPAGTPRLVIEASVGLGAVFVVDRPLVGGFQPGLYGRNEACRPAAQAAA